VWIGKGTANPRKICALGVKTGRWVSMHGFAFNVNTDLQYFRNIVPCGIDDKDKDVTSLSVELGRAIDLGEVREKILFYFSELFEFEVINENN
jgi:lipoyl(octanoyl) transferase